MTLLAGGYMSVKSAKRRMLQKYRAAWRCDEGWAANETSMELEFAFVDVIELVGVRLVIQGWHCGGAESIKYQRTAQPLDPFCLPNR